MKKITILIIACIFCSLFSYSQTLTEYRFNNTPYLKPSVTDTLVEASDFLLSSGTIGTNKTTGDYFTSEPYIEEGGGWNSNTLDQTKYFTFTVNAKSGHLLSLNNLEFEAYATSSGPEFLTVTLNNDSIFSTNLKDSLTKINIPLSGYNNIQETEVKIHGRLNGSRASSGGGTLRIDEVKLVGFTREVDIIATEIRTGNMSNIWIKDSLYRVILIATDSLGNIDTDYNSEFSLSDSDELIKPENYNSTFTNGVYNQEGFMLSHSDTFKLSVNSSTLNNLQADIICASPVYIPHLHENALSKWLNADNWDTTTINNRLVIKHNLTDVSGISHLAKAYDNNSIFGEGKTAWRFVIENGDFDPSSANGFWYYLMASDENLTSESIYGYAAGVNLYGSNDTLSLWRIDPDGNMTLLLKSDFDWNENTTCAIEVTRSNNGKWQLGWHKEYGFDSLYHSGYTTDKTYCSLNYHGLVFKHNTASRAGKLTFIPELYFQIEEAPSLISVNAYSQNKIELKFSENISSQSLNIPNYKLTNNLEETIAITNIAHGNSQASIILTCEELNTGNYFIYINSIEDNEGFNAESIMHRFVFSVSANFGDIVINEIMAKPSADYGLPDVEYVEIYNRSNFDICTKNWIFNYGTSFKIIDSAIIKPHEYITLCDIRDTALFSPFGKCIGINSMPAMAESGAITIYNSDTLPVTHIKYKSSWISEELKANGGYSLERIDTDNLSNTNNWKASNDIKGGTPCHENSVKSENPDIEHPNIIKVVPISDNSIIAYFDKSMGFQNIQANDFTLNGESPLSAIWQQPDYSSVILTFGNNFENGNKYLLSVNSSSPDISGNTINRNEVAFMLPEPFFDGDIIINEVLFDPYPNCTDFVELYNPNSFAVNLSELHISSRDDDGLLETKYSISEEGYILMPDSYAIICEDKNMITNCYNVENPFAIIESKLPSLPNDGGSVVLLDIRNNIIDELTYSENMHFNLLDDTEGVSLERVNPALPTYDKGNWHSASANSGWATPTYKNSMYKDYKTVSNEEIRIDPKNFSPDNDGYEDILKIFYSFEKQGLVGNVSIFNKNGYRIKSLTENELLAQSGSWTWNGLTDENSKAPAGIYVIHIEVFNAEGQIKDFKKVCTVNARF